MPLPAVTFFVRLRVNDDDVVSTLQHWGIIAVKNSNLHCSDLRTVYFVGTGPLFRISDSVKIVEYDRR